MKAGILSKYPSKQSLHKVFPFIWLIPIEFAVFS